MKNTPPQYICIFNTFYKQKQGKNDVLAHKIRTRSLFT